MSKMTSGFLIFALMLGVLFLLDGITFPAAAVALVAATIWAATMWVEGPEAEPEATPQPASAEVELATVNQLFLELSQFTTAKTARELAMEELLRSAHAIALRNGEGTAWDRFATSIRNMGIGSVTARVYRMLPSDEAEVHS